MMKSAQNKFIKQKIKGKIQKKLQGEIRDKTKSRTIKDDTWEMKNTLSSAKEIQSITSSKPDYTCRT